MPQLPRVLVISPCVFNYQNGGGVTFSNLFQGWPQNALANLHSSPQDPDKSVCANFYRLSGEDIVRPWPLRKRGPSSLGAATTEKNSSLSTKGNFRKAIHRFYRDRIVGNSGLPQAFQPSSALLEWLDKFKPEVIYTILGPIPHLDAILFIQNRYNCRIVVHCMDDWYDQAYTSGVFRFQRSKMLKKFKEIFDKADQCLAIGESMAKEFSKRFHKQFTAFQNTIDVRGFSAQSQKYREEGTKSTMPRVLYFGSVLPFAQLDAIAEVAEAIDATQKFQFEIITIKECISDCEAKLGHLKSVKLSLITKDQEHFCRELSQADILLLPSNFDPASVEFLKYSMPTKVPGYLASGTPILVYGPKEVAQVQYAIENKWARCVTTQSKNEIAEALLELQSNKAENADLVQTALKVAEKNHDAINVRRAFQELLAKV